MWLLTFAGLDVFTGSLGSVVCVTILNKAAIGSNSNQGGFVVSISTTVQPKALKKYVDY